MPAISNDIPHEVLIGVWDWHLDGRTNGDIARYGYALFPAGATRELRAAEVREILASPPPETVANDPRFLHGVRAFWISASGLNGKNETIAKGCVFAFQPPRLTATSFRKALRAICRDMKSLATKRLLPL